MDPGEQLELLVLRCQVGDNHAFEKLFELFQPRLKYFVRRLDRADGGTEDILQDIWLTVVKKIHQVRDPKSFSVWIYRIARNKVYGKFRKKEKFVQLREEELAIEPAVGQSDFAAESAEKIHEGLDNIQPQHREVLTLRFIEEMTYQAIAEIIGCSIGTVKSRIHYAKQSLRKHLESDNG